MQLAVRMKISTNAIWAARLLLTGTYRTVPNYVLGGFVHSFSRAPVSLVVCMIFECPKQVLWLARAHASIAVTFDGSVAVECQAGLGLYSRASG